MPVPKRAQWQERSGPKPMSLFLHLAFVYVLLQAFAYAFDSGIFRLLSSLFAFWVFGVVLVNALFLAPIRHLPDEPPLIGVGVLTGLALYYIGMGGNLLILRGHNDLQDWSKIFMAPAFLVFGLVFASRKQTDVWASPLNRVLFWLMVILPIAVWAFQLATGKTSLGGGKMVGTFVNRNNASLYYLTLIAFFGALSRKPVTNVVVYLVAGMAFGTLGVLMAVLLSLLLAVGKWKYAPHLVLAAALVAVLVIALPEEWVYARLMRVVDSYRLLIEGRINLRTVTYADLVRLLGTSDLSFIFRLKHWVDLLDMYAGGTVYEKLFGFGAGSSIRMSQMHLVPHNDFVRYLFEFGAITWTGFVIVLVAALSRLGRSWAAAPLLGVVIYFSSENLINNFLAMIVFYFSLGCTLYRERAKVVPQSVAAAQPVTPVLTPESR